MSFRLAAGMLAPFAAAGLLASCEETPENQTGGEDRQVPSVTVTAVQAGETYLTFNLSPVNSAEVRYLVLPASDQAPDAMSVMSGGKEADPAESGDYTEDGLVPSTDYVIFAAARNPEGLTSLVAKTEMTTAAHVPVYPEITLSSVIVDDLTASFTYTLESAESAYYLYLPASETAPSAEDLSDGGMVLPTETSEPVVIEGLSYSTSYVLYAVAKNADGYSAVASEPFETGAAPLDPPEVGDFYYSDGTWSPGSDAPFSGKTVIGVVFKTGAAESDLSDYSQAGIEEIKGFVVAIGDSEVPGEDIFDIPVRNFVFSESALGVTSTDENDFSGYYNTLKIREAVGGTLSDDNAEAAYMAADYYELSVPAPETSTGWYLPSLGQWRVIYDVKDIVYASIEEAGGSAVYDYDSYWSSTESASGSRAYSVQLTSSEFRTEVVNISRLWRVRPVLAF